MRHRSLQKWRTTAAIVPSCTTAVKAAPGSSQPKNAGMMRRWAVDEIGRNSVRPWTIPRTIAWNALTGGTVTGRPRPGLGTARDMRPRVPNLVGLLE